MVGGQLKVPQPGEPRGQPDKVAQGVVLGMGPLLFELTEGPTVKADVRPVHRIGVIDVGRIDRRQAVAVLVEVVQQRADALDRDLRFPDDQVGMRDVHVVPHPDVLVAGRREVLGVAGRCREQAVVKAREPKSPLRVQESDQRTDIRFGPE